MRFHHALALVLPLVPACGYSVWDPACDGSDEWTADRAAMRVVLTELVDTGGGVHDLDELGPDASMQVVLLDRYGTTEGLYLEVIVQTDEDLLASCVEVRAQVTVDEVASVSRASTLGAVELHDYAPARIESAHTRSYLVRIGVPIDDLSLSGPLPDARIDLDVRGGGLRAGTSREVRLCRSVCE